MPARAMHYPVETYRQLEAKTELKHEYLDGEIYAMPRGTPEHAAIAATIIARLSSARPGCHVYTGDLRVQAGALTTYPDAMVICGPAQTAPGDPHTAVNPILLVDVTSEATEDYDRGAKLAYYRQIPSLREVLIVSHRERCLSVHRLNDIAQEVHSYESVTLQSVGVTLAVDDIYEGTEVVEHL